MPQKTDLNVAPYYDDFDSSDNFVKTLFRPGFAIQARELTQLQSILSNQTGDFILPKRIDDDETYKLSLCGDEYFLFENSNNEFYYEACNEKYSLDELEYFFLYGCNYLESDEICDYNCDGIEDEEIDEDRIHS